MFSANNCRPNQKIEKRAFASTNLSIALSKDSNCLDREQKNGKNEQIGFSSRCHISLWYCTLPTVDLRYTFGVGCSIFKRIQCKIFDKCKMFKLYKNTISEKAKNEGSFSLQELFHLYHQIIWQIRKHYLPSALGPNKNTNTNTNCLYHNIYKKNTCHPHSLGPEKAPSTSFAFATT